MKAKKAKSTTAKVSSKRTLKTESSQFPIVGIGSSAGGLEALEEFFANMPADCGMAFVVIQHLDPTYSGVMPELLQRITNLKVIQASDNLKAKPNFVYVIPPNKSLTLLKGVIHLFEPVEIRGLRLPVDIFFKSLANDREDKSIGIILSGMGSDGSLGLKSIKEKNGCILVQEPNSAKFDGMPRSAIEAVNVDVIAPAAELPGKLIDFLKYVPIVKKEIEEDTKSKSSSLDHIIILLREQTGCDFSAYKKNTLFRRIERRKAVYQIDEVQNYVRFLQENPAEVEILFKELLIGVTSFFRDPSIWEKLEENILPDLLEELPNGHILRAWVPACSTGEEAYSLAILFKEVLEKSKNRKNISLQIFATDIDIEAIEKARKGLFASNIISNLSPERLNRFFAVDGDNYRIKNAIREMIVFAPQNVIRDPPFTNLNLISCRNMLIYMQPELQKKIITLFNYSLVAEGILLLGSSETLGDMKDGFKELDAKLKIYKCKSDANIEELSGFPSSFYHHKTETTKKNIPPKVIDSIQTVVDNIIIQQYAPASVVVNDKGDIVYITGRTGKYLEPVAGKANWNIYAMAREGLRHELPAAFRKAKQSYKEVILRNINIGTNGGTQFINVTIQHIEKPDTIQGMFIVVFNEVISIVENANSNLKTRKRSSTRSQEKTELELQHALEELQIVREEMQTSQEELKSTNEELQSTNEELQSTNEELTTSKEEMQSLNEELQTVNAELQSKINDYELTNNDMKNLLNSTEIATLFIDKEMNIRRFTDPMTEIFKLRNSDIGRPFTDLVTNLEYPDIDKHAHKVLKTLESVEVAIAATNGKWYNIRTMPYRTFDDRIDGLVITFSDITKYKYLEIELEEAKKNIR